MEFINNERANYYLLINKASKPFFSNDELKEKILMDLIYNGKEETSENMINSLINLIHKYVIPIREEDFNTPKKNFHRTAEEIWKSGVANGCDDYAVLFNTFAKQLKLNNLSIPAILKNKLLNNIYLMNLQKNENVFYDFKRFGEWVVSSINENNEVIAYNKEDKIEAKMSIKEFNKSNDTAVDDIDTNAEIEAYKKQ